MIRSIIANTIEMMMTTMTRTTIGIDAILTCMLVGVCLRQANQEGLLEIFRFAP